MIFSRGDEPRLKWSHQDPLSNPSSVRVTIFKSPCSFGRGVWAYALTNFAQPAVAHRPQDQAQLCEVWAQRTCCVFSNRDTPVLDWRQSSGSSRLETNASKIGVIFPAWCVTPRWTNASLSRRVVLGGEFMSPHIHPLPTTLLQETDVLQSRTTVAAGVA